MRLHRWLKHLPNAARNSMQFALQSFGPHLRDSWLQRLPRQLKGALTRSRLQKMSEVLQAPDTDVLYRQMLSIWANPLEVVHSDAEAHARLWEAHHSHGLDNFLEHMQFTDIQNYLPDDILTKVDRASMAVALEARVPLIDYRVVEFAWQLPYEMKVRDGKGKWILRQILSSYVPDHLIDRPKKGFGVPLGTWLRGQLRDWAESLLSEKELGRHGLLNVDVVRRTWQDHLSGEQNRETHLWLMLMLQSWLRMWA
jgi:asparagine synthase (glutamine-hydrolysing)